MTGAVGQRRVPSQFLKDTLIPLPPPDVQHIIVTQLDSLSARARWTREQLERIPRLIKRYKRAVIRSASQGTLTSDWRQVQGPQEHAHQLVCRINEHRSASSHSKKNGQVSSKHARHESLSALSDRNAPKAWCQVRLGAIADCLDHRGIPINKIQRQSRQGSVPYYGANGQVGWIDRHLFDEDLVLVVEDETFLGRERPFSYVIRGKSWVNNHAHVLKPLAGITVEFLNICLSYYDLTPLTSGTTGRRKLRQKALLNAPLLLPPLAEQAEIVRRIEAVFIRIHTIASEFESAAKLLGRLEQASVAKALRGELTGVNGSSPMAEVDLLAEIESRAIN